MKIKKIASLFLAGVLAASLAVPMFAAYDVDSNMEDVSYQVSHSVELSGVIQSPEIRMKVPTTGGKLILNPYAMSFSTEEFTGQQGTSTDQIITPIQYLANYSNTNVNIGVSAYALPTAADTGTGRPKSDAILATKSALTLTTKSVFLYLQVKATNAIGNGYSNTAFTTTTYDSKAKDQVVVGSTAAKPGILTDVVTLAAAQNDTTLSATGNGVAAIRISGDCASNPAFGSDWKATDTLTMTIAYTFEPTNNPATTYTA